MSTIGIIGMGWVGNSVASATLQRGIASRLLLNDVRADVAEGEAMDFAHAALLYPAATVEAVAVEEMRQADIVVVAAGRNGRPGESRLDLLRDNARVAVELGRVLQGFDGIVVMVTNPVDVLTEILRRAADLPPERVFGTGTTLDSMRLRKEVADRLNIHPQSVHAQVLGEHGDSEVINWSAADAGARLLRDWPGWSAQVERDVATRVRVAAYEIIRRKGATNHAIGMVTASVLQAVVADERRILNVSRRQDGAAGLHDVTLSLPTVVDVGGARRVVEPAMSADERDALVKSAEILRKKLAEVA